MEKRLVHHDNLKAALMFLVLFGHLLELVPGHWAGVLYRVIYSFHMPLFLFLTGYFARFRPRRILLFQLWPYFLLQTLYLVFDARVLQGGAAVTLQYTTPYWLLWYLLAVILYQLLLPLLDTDRLSLQILAVAGSLLLSLLVGYDRTIGYYMTLSRFFVFLPFFLLGCYARKHGAVEALRERKSARLAVLLSGGVLAFLGLLFIKFAHVQATALYGSASYAALGYSPITRGALFLTALGWCAFLLMLAPGKPIPVVTALGRRTFCIFCLHGFAVRLLKLCRPFRFGQGGNLLLAAALAAALLLVLGSKPVSEVFSWVFTGKWLDRLAQRRKKDT